MAENGVCKTNESRTSRVNTKLEGYIVESLPTNQATCAVLANLLISKGEPSQVIELSCEHRTGQLDLITCIRRSLDDHYSPKGQTVALGGAFVLECGSAKQHVMPDFSSEPLNTDQEVNDWLKFYEMPAPLVAVGTLVSKDPGLDLRMQHFHSASPDQKHAGHYHYDSTPDVVLYRAVLIPAQYLTRIDRPQQTHNVGRD